MFPLLQLQLEIYSRCYNEQPLVIQGAGAGNDATAAGVLADLLDIQDLFPWKKCLVHVEVTRFIIGQFHPQNFWDRDAGMKTILYMWNTIKCFRLWCLFEVWIHDLTEIKEEIGKFFVWFHWYHIASCTVGHIDNWNRWISIAWMTVVPGSFKSFEGYWNWFVSQIITN